jgi:polysaccharide biosynthesis/export protein
MSSPEPASCRPTRNINSIGGDEMAQIVSLRWIRAIHLISAWLGERAPARRRRVLACLAGSGLLLASCAPGSGLPPLANTPSGPYRLGVDEQVRIITFGEAQMTGQFQVNDRGSIAVPLLGPVPAAGLTTSQLEQSIAQRLQDKKILLNPSVSVEVVRYRPIFILGEVNRPGEYPYQPGMTVLTAVAIAGGFTYRAQTGYASIVREINNHGVEGRVPRSANVMPGDVINIYERYF